MGRIFLLLITMALAACEGAVRDPVGLGGGGGGIIVGGGGGGGGGGTGGGVLLGAWETNFVFQTSNDVQRHTVTWSFSAGGACRRGVEIYSVLEDRTLTTTASCTFTSGGGEVAITWAGSSTAVTFGWSLEHFSPDRLILDGVTYDRIG